MTLTPVFSDLDAFVRDYFVRVVERRIAVGAAGGLVWCDQWWAHPEAINRLGALWLAWETLRVSDPAMGMSIWWRDHLDPHLGALCAEDGPFARCRPGRHTPPQPLPVEPCPLEILAKLPRA
ncbi:MAG: DUF4913 domain-containing protein [Dactylosporangium sp.]|nr:DUF4913 domain-containing protein [Dactylosporangium sp.]